MVGFSDLLHKRDFPQLPMQDVPTMGRVINLGEDSGRGNGRTLFQFSWTKLVYKDMLWNGKEMGTGYCL